tara:strand:+ start:396 stop:1487 length:1092 start_codon:yes stop_codon:yes gene_type:complete
MATLAGNTISSTYPLLLKIDSTGVDGTLRKVEDGDATDSSLSISTTAIAIDATDKLYFDGGTHTYIDESAADIMDFFAGGTHMLSLDKTNTEVVINEGSADINFRVEGNGDANLLFADAGNDRIGIGTDSPDGMLDIYSSAAGLPNVYIQNSSTSQQTGGALIFTNIDTNTDLGNNIIIGEILIKAGDPSDDALINAARIKFSMDGAGDTNDINGKIVFETGTGNGTLNERLTIKAAGNVGVGTTSPDTKLEVVGSFAANGPSSTFVTFADGDATPLVSTGNIFKHHASTQTITMFDGGICGQIITVISTAAITYDVTSTNLKGGSTDLVTANGESTVWVFDGTNWYLIGYMDLSQNYNVDGV